MQPATVRFSDQRVVFDRVTRGSYLVRIAGQFVGYGVDPHEVPTMQQWLAQAAFHALDRFQQPLSELPKHQVFWSAEVTNLVNPVFQQQFRAQGTVQFVAIEVLPAASPASMAPSPPAPSPLAPSPIVLPPPSAVAQPAPPAQAPQALPKHPVVVNPVAPLPPVNRAPIAAPAPPPPPPPVEDPISSGPAVALDPWELTLRPIVDPPTSVAVAPTVIVAFTGTAIADKRLDAVKTLAAACVADAIAKECEGGRSVLDLVLFASSLSSAANERFEREVLDKGRARGSLSVRDIHLSQEDAERLRDLYGQIAAARGG